MCCLLYKTRSYRILYVYSLQEITCELKRHATEAIRLEALIVKTPADQEVQQLTLQLVDIRTRIASLLTQAENGSQTLIVSTTVNG